jgi:hypothetical protein
VLPAVTPARILSRAYGAVEIRPSAPGEAWLQLEALRGAVRRASFLVANSGPRRQPVSLYAVDAMLARRSGAFTLAARNAPSSDVGAWVRLPAARLTLPPRTQRELSFELRVPDGTAPGLHTGAIVAESPPSTVAIPGRGDRIRVVTRIGLRIYARVPADASARLSLSGLRARQAGWGTPLPLKLVGLRSRPRLAVSAELRNTSSRPSGQLSARAEILSHANSVAGSAVRQVASVPPGRSVRLAIPLRVAGAGRGGYRARLVVRAGNDRLSVERAVAVRSWALSPLRLALAGLVLVLALGAGWHLVRRRHALRQS